MVERLVARRGSSSPLRGAVVLGVMALAVGCGRSNRVTPQGNVPSDGGDTGMGTGGSAVTGGSGGSGGRGGSAGSVASGGSSGSEAGGTSGAAGEGGEPACGIAPTGVVRLSLLQVKSALAALLGPEAAEELTLAHGIPTHETAAVPALLRDGQSIGSVEFPPLDLLAQATGQYVRENLEAVTGCTAAPTDECARAFLEGFAERAFRKAREGAELDLVLFVYDGARADLGASVEEALEAGVYAVLESPRFLYRLELGAPDAAPGTVPLQPHEVANALAFFLTAGPPDAELLAAAAAGALESPADLEPQIARLLAGEAARARLTAATGTHFGLQSLPNVTLDGTHFPAWNAGLAAAMELESRRFLASTLWSEPLPSLLTSRITEVNAELAAVYDVAFPPLDDALDGQGFGRVELPVNRSGLLTQAGILTARSRPNGDSVVDRGVWVMSQLLCRPLPPQTEHPEIQSQETDTTQAERVAFRAQAPLCAGCHSELDPYGLVLEEFDGIGRYRQVDAEGRPIDARTTLPESLGSVPIASAAELGRVLAERDDLARCLGATFLGDALSGRWQVEVPAQSCEVEEIVREFAAGDDQSFGGLVRAIALSPAFRQRAKGETP